MLKKINELHPISWKFVKSNVFANSARSRYLKNFPFLYIVICRVLPALQEDLKSKHFIKIWNNFFTQHFA
jgi:hypothetical protein